MQIQVFACGDGAALHGQVSLAGECGVAPGLHVAGGVAGRAGGLAAGADSGFLFCGQQLQGPSAVQCDVASGFDVTGGQRQVALGGFEAKVVAALQLAVRGCCRGCTQAQGAFGVKRAVLQRQLPTCLQLSVLAGLQLQVLCRHVLGRLYLGAAPALQNHALLMLVCLVDLAVLGARFTKDRSGQATKQSAGLGCALGFFLGVLRVGNGLQLHTALVRLDLDVLARLDLCALQAHILGTLHLGAAAAFERHAHGILGLTLAQLLGGGLCKNPQLWP